MSNVARARRRQVPATIGLHTFYFDLLTVASLVVEIVITDILEALRRTGICITCSTTHRETNQASAGLSTTSDSLGILFMRVQMYAYGYHHRPCSKLSNWRKGHTHTHTPHWLSGDWLAL